MERVEYEKLLVQDLVNQERSGELNLSPWYQRRSVWTPPQKSYLINTLFEQKPIPSLYVRHSLDLAKEKSIKEVVDGQQRIRAILEYTKNEFAARHPNHDSPVKHDKLSRSEKEEYRMTSLSVGYLIGASDSDVIEIFGRLNSVAKTLNLQEKRNAMYSGEFKQFCLSEGSCRLPVWRTYNLFTANDIARMLEIQFVSELTINMLDGLQDYSGKIIDQYYERFDDHFGKSRALSARMEQVFAKLAGLSVDAIRDTIFSRVPLFFTLFLILDTHGSISSKRLEDALFHTDEKFHTDLPIADRPKADAAFFVACTSNMHRIKSRQIRDTYLRKQLGVRSR